MFRFRNNKVAFTLIELLVVIAIISLLAAILFPVFGRARENSRRASCQSNLKQITLGVKQYTQDYDEKFPLSANFAETAYDSAWASSIQPYIKSLQVYQCPTDKKEPKDDPSEVGYTDYWYNAALSWNGLFSNAQNYRTAVSEAALVNSTLTILVGEGNNSTYQKSSYRTNGCTVAGASSLNAPNFGNCDTTTYLVNGQGIAGGQKKHMGGLNLAFSDGHVKWFKANEEAGSNDISSTVIYNVRSGFQRSKNSPTFNATSETDR